MDDKILTGSFPIIFFTLGYSSDCNFYGEQSYLPILDRCITDTVHRIPLNTRAKMAGRTTIPYRRSTDDTRRLPQVVCILSMLSREVGLITAKYEHAWFRLTRSDRDLLVLSNKYIDELRGLLHTKSSAIQALIEVWSYDRSFYAPS